MSEKYFRIIFGSLIILVLYFDLQYLMYGMILYLVFEGATNWRMTLILSRIRFGRLRFVNKNIGCRMSFDAERMWRFGVALSLFLTGVVFSEAMWFFPWFMGFMLIIAGMTNLCAMVMFFNWIGFCNNVCVPEAWDSRENAQIADQWVRSWDESIAIRITSIILWILIAIVSFSSALIYRNYKQDMETNRKKTYQYVNYIVESTVNAEGEISEEKIKRKLKNDVFEFYDLLSISISYESEEIRIENTNKIQYTDLHEMTSVIPYRDRFGQSHRVSIVQHYPSIKEQLETRRKNILVLMALGVMLFGILLERTVNLFLHNPINLLVQATKRISDGDMKFRLETDRNDEFGQLSSFFNRMLDQILEEQNYVISTLAYLTAIIENMADALVVIDRHGIITHANPSFYKMFGKDRSQIIGSNIDTVSGLLKINEMKKISGDSPREIYEGEIPLKDNRMGKSIATGVLNSIVSHSGEELDDSPGIVIIIRDITNEKEADKMKTDFISVVSHELRTPLTSVVGFSKLIKKKLNKDVFPNLDLSSVEIKKSIGLIKTDIDIIVSEGNRLTALINDVLDIAKMEAGKTEWKITAMDLSDAVFRARAVALPLIQSKNIEILCEIDYDLPLVYGDKDRIFQVLINLLSNAVKFTEAGRIICRIFKRTDDKIQVNVQDEGIGIAPADQQKIFEKFQQAGYILTDRPTGTGLGLPISKHIIQQHGGEIWVDSSPGNGSTFSFTLPFREEELRPIRFLNMESFMRRLHIQQNENFPAKKKTILIIDDQHEFRLNLKEKFNEYGFDVHFAGNVTEAIYSLNKMSPDFILIFLHLPVINSIEASVLLHENPVTDRIPSGILTIHETDGEAILGLIHYYPRPFDMELILKNAEDSMPEKKAVILKNNGFPSETIIALLERAGFDDIKVCDSEECVKSAACDRPSLVVSETELMVRKNGFDQIRREKSLEDTTLFILED